MDDHLLRSCRIVQTLQIAMISRHCCISAALTSTTRFNTMMYPHWREWQDVFDSTEPGSIIRQLFVDAIVYKAPIAWMYDRDIWKTLRDLPEVFLDIARCSTQRANGRRNPFEKGYKETYFVQAHEYLKALEEDPLDPWYLVAESKAPLTAFCQPDSRPVIERTPSDSYVLESLPPRLEPGVRP